MCIRDRYNSLYLRSLYKPTINDQRLLLVMIITGVLLAILIAIDIYFASKNTTAILSAIEGLKQVSATVGSKALTGGA